MAEKKEEEKPAREDAGNRIPKQAMTDSPNVSQGQPVEPRVTDPGKPTVIVKQTPIPEVRIYGQTAHKKYTLGMKAADKITKWGGSWVFITSFMVFVFIWMGINLYSVFIWDVYPFILLNLVLSCLAAIQAPVILMSQNRASDRDRIKAERDYAVNRKAERELEFIKKDLDFIKKRLAEINARLK
jgi:uncharacterized membrane protein